MKIRTGNPSEIENFPLYCEGNDGDEILVAVDGDEVIGYAQFTGDILYFIESEKKGTGTALIETLKANNWHLTAHNVEPTAKGFYEKMGFEVTGGNGWGGQFNMEWWED